MTLTIAVERLPSGDYIGYVRDPDDGMLTPTGIATEATPDPIEAHRRADAARKQIEAAREPGRRKNAISSHVGTHGRGWQRGMRW